MDKYDVSSRLRSNQFPYHVTAASPSMSKSASLAAVSQRRKDLRNYSDNTPTTYMVVNFDDRFVESIPSEMPSIVRVNEKRTQEILDKMRNNSPNKPGDKQLRIPKLASSYVLPRQIQSESDRNMFRRADATTQTEVNMNKLNFEGMTGYQNWTAEVVEPFLKVQIIVHFPLYTVLYAVFPVGRHYVLFAIFCCVIVCIRHYVITFCYQDLRKEIKAKRPQDINAYIITYCQAMQKREAPPETIDTGK